MPLVNDSRGNTNHCTHERPNMDSTLLATLSGVKRVDRE
jgi:hypothetical protein